MFQIVVVLIVVGVALWLINKYVPMEAWVKRLINIVVVVCVVVWLMNIVGLFGYLKGVPAPHL